MAKIGRNEPCPCGSGKKQKRCCLAQPPAPLAHATASAEPTGSLVDICDCCIDDLNDRADEVLDVLLAGHVDEAEALCHAFSRDFPGQAEGLDLLSMIFEERGQRERALDLLRQATALADANPHEYDLDTRTMMHERINELALQA